MVTWTDNIPASNRTPANDQPLMLGNFTYLSTSLAVDHNFTKNTATAADGYHKIIHQQNAAGNVAPAPIANTGQTFVLTPTLAGNTDQGLYFLSGGNRLTQLTSVFQSVINSSAASMVFLPGGLFLITGTFTFNANPKNFLFPIGGIWGNGFPTNCFNVVINPQTSSALPSGGGAWKVSNVSQTGFTATSNNFTSGQTWSFIAFGN